MRNLEADSRSLLTLTPGRVGLPELRALATAGRTVALADGWRAGVERSELSLRRYVESGAVVYGVNTGFGRLAHKRIADTQLAELQLSIVRSHAAGVGDLLAPAVVRLVLVLKALSLARGFSGVRSIVVQRLLDLYNADILPCIPSQGSVGASGDLAPLAHMAMALIGEGEAHYRGAQMLASRALAAAGIAPLELGPKEGLALLNGTQVSTALALVALVDAEDLLRASLILGAMSVEAALGSHVPFDVRIHEIRGHRAQIDVAAAFRELLAGSEIVRSHADCDRVQDPYSLRCQPQVAGACLSQMRHAAADLVTEANAVSDNPLVFADTQGVLSGGNFHAEPVAMAADAIAVAVAEIGALAERRIALLIDPTLSRLPPFLVADSGLNSGFMLAQVTAAALASENKSLAHPASVDSIPTSANQEDHVSMATFAARRLGPMIENTRGVLAVEWLAAAQGIDFRRPLRSSASIEAAHALLRSQVAFYHSDRYFAPDLNASRSLLSSAELLAIAPPRLVTDWHEAQAQRRVA